MIKYAAILTRVPFGVARTAILYSQLTRDGASDLLARMHLIIEDNGDQKNVIEQILEQIGQ